MQPKRALMKPGQNSRNFTYYKKIKSILKWTSYVQELIRGCSNLWNKKQGKLPEKVQKLSSTPPISNSQLGFQIDQKPRKTLQEILHAWWANLLTIKVVQELKRFWGLGFWRRVSQKEPRGIWNFSNTVSSLPRFLHVYYSKGIMHQ